jgi:hypothetical protein
MGQDKISTVLLAEMKSLFALFRFFNGFFV